MATPDESKTAKELERITAGLSIEDLEALSKCEIAYNEISRKETGTVFLLGQHFAEVKNRLPGRWERWAKLKCDGVTKRTLTNYIAVWREFSPKRQRIERSKLRPAHLYALIGARDEVVDEVLRAAERKERLTIAMIRKLHPKPARAGTSNGTSAEAASLVPAVSHLAAGSDLHPVARQMLEGLLVPRLAEIIAGAVRSAEQLLEQMDDFTGMPEEALSISETIASLRSSVAILSTLKGENEIENSAWAALDEWQNTVDALFDLPAHLSDEARMVSSRYAVQRLLPSRPAEDRMPDGLRVRGRDQANTFA